MHVIYILSIPIKAFSFFQIDDKITVFIAFLSYFISAAIICVDICGWELAQVCFHPEAGFSSRCTGCASSSSGPFVCFVVTSLCVLCPIIAAAVLLSLTFPPPLSYISVLTQSSPFFKFCYFALFFQA